MRIIVFLQSNPQALSPEYHNAAQIVGWKRVAKNLQLISGSAWVMLTVNAIVLGVFETREVAPRHRPAGWRGRVCGLVLR